MHHKIHLVATIIWFEKRKHCRTYSRSDLNDAKRLLSRPLPGGTCTKLPWRTNTWLTSSRMSHPSTIIRSTARFLRRFSVSETSSCICLVRKREKQTEQFSLSRTQHDISLRIEYDVCGKSLFLHTHLLRSSSCWRAFCKLFLSTWSCGVWAKSSCRVMI